MRIRPLNLLAIGVLVFSLGLASQAIAQSGMITQVAIPLPAALNTVDVNPNTNQVYVGGNINNVVQNIVWVDGNTDHIIKSIGAGQGLRVNPATNKIYAADLYGGHILVYSGSDGSLQNTISAFGCPVEVVVDSSLNHIWGSAQCGGGNDPVFLIDGNTNTLISGYVGSGGVMGGAMVVNPSTHALYVSAGGVEKEVNASTLAASNSPFSASVDAFNLLAGSMYGADSTGKNVMVVNYGTESVVATIPVSQTGAIAVNPTRNRVYAVDLSVSPQAIRVISGVTNTLIGSIPLPSGYQACCTMAVNSSTGTIYLPATNSGSGFLLAVVDTLTDSSSTNPLAVTSLVPSTAVAGTGALPMTVNGSGFVSGSVVQWNGAPLPTTFVSAMQLTVVVPAGDLNSAGVAEVNVNNPGLPTSNLLSFTISQIGSSYTGCNGQPATGNLQLFVMNLNAITGVVEINGVAIGAANTPFSWNWGDGAATQGFFPQSHTYSNVQQNYALQVTSQQNNGSTDCAQLSIPFQSQTTGVITSVTTSNGGPVIAQSDFIVVRGTNLVPANTPASGVIWSSAPSFASGLMPTQLGGVSVTVNGKPAFVYFYCSAATDPACPKDQINVITPLDNTVGTVPVVLTSGGVSSPPFSVSMQAVAPSFFLFNDAGDIAGTHANSSPLGPTTLYPGASTPAAVGETIVTYATGFGLPAASLVNGSATQSGSLPVLPVCQIGGAPAVVAFAGLISPGLYQLNLTIPAAATNGYNTVSCTYNGASTPAGDRIAVQAGPPTPAPLALLDDVTSNQTGTVNNVCTLPPSVTSFTTTAPSVYLYFDVNGAAAGDMETTTFYRPDGVQYYTDTSPVTAIGANGYTCITYDIFVAGYPAASYPGVWTASTTWNNSAKPLFSLNFNLVSPPPPGQFNLTAAAGGSGSGSVSPSPVGASCGTSCWNYLAGTAVTVTAIPTAGSTFAGWSGCTGSGVTCAVTMNSNQAVTATFNLTVANKPTLTIATSGTGGGTVGSSPAGTSCGSGCLTFTTGTIVTLTASPSTGSTFGGWSGACSGTGSCTVTMNSNLAVTATFSLTPPPTQQYTLTTGKSGTGSGTVSPPSPLGTPCGANCWSYPAGTNVTLTATPGTGSTFGGWSGACSGTGSCTVTMNSNLAVTAVFSLTPPPAQQYTLTTATSGTGTGTVGAPSPLGTPCGANCWSYPAGASVTLTASPSTGSSFGGWSGACSGTGSCTVTMNSNLAVTAIFSLTAPTQQYTLTTATSTTGTGNGAVGAPSPLGTPCGTNCWSYPAGTVVTLTANPAIGSAFAGWSGACSGQGSTCTVTMNVNQTVTATFNQSGGRVIFVPPATIKCTSSGGFGLNCSGSVTINITLPMAVGTPLSVIISTSDGGTFFPGFATTTQSPPGPLPFSIQASTLGCPPTLTNLDLYKVVNGVVTGPAIASLTGLNISFVCP